MLKEKESTWNKEVSLYQKSKASLMQKLLIKGKKYLNGSIPISGSKNATLPILAASILANTVKLKNVPLVKDIFTMIDLLKFIVMVSPLQTTVKQMLLELQTNQQLYDTLLSIIEIELASNQENNSIN